MELEKDETARAADLRDQVSLVRDAHRGEWWIHNALTGETALLPSQCHEHLDLQIFYVDGGLTALVMGDEMAEDVDVDDVFLLTPLTTSTGRTMVNPGSVKTEDFYDQRVKEYTYGRICATVGAYPGHESKWEIAIYDLPRIDGCRCMLSAVDLYELLAVSTHVGTSYGDWAKEHWGSWVTRTRSGEEGYLQNGQPYRRGGALPADSVRNLPWRSLSTAGVVSVLSRMAWGTTREGGVQNEALRNRGGEVLELLLRLAASTDWVLRLVSDNRDSYVPPPPVGPRGHFPFVSNVVGGVVHMPSHAENWFRPMAQAWKNSAVVGPGEATWLVTLLKI